MDTLVNLSGVLLMGLIVWWFWLSKPRTAHIQTGSIDIVVDNGVYTPARIEVPAGKPVVLRFMRKDASPCAEKVVFDDFGITRDLPLNEFLEVSLTPDKPGEYEFSCQMRMYRGTLVVI